MQLMAHNPEKARKGAGPSSEVTREMIHKTSKEQRKKFAKK